MRMILYSGDQRYQRNRQPAQIVHCALYKIRYRNRQKIKRQRQDTCDHTHIRDLFPLESYLFLRIPAHHLDTVSIDQTVEYDQEQGRAQQRLISVDGGDHLASKNTTAPGI